MKFHQGYIVPRNDIETVPDIVSRSSAIDFQHYHQAPRTRPAHVQPTVKTPPYGIHQEAVPSCFCNLYNEWDLFISYRMIFPANSNTEKYYCNRTNFSRKSSFARLARKRRPHFLSGFHPRLLLLLLFIQQSRAVCGAQQTRLS